MEDGFKQFQTTNDDGSQGNEYSHKKNSRSNRSCFSRGIRKLRKKRLELAISPHKRPNCTRSKRHWSREDGIGLTKAENEHTEPCIKSPLSYPSSLYTAEDEAILPGIVLASSQVLSSLYTAEDEAILPGIALASSQVLSSSIEMEEKLEINKTVIPGVPQTNSEDTTDPSVHHQTAVDTTKAVENFVQQQVQTRYMAALPESNSEDSAGPSVHQQAAVATTEVRTMDGDAVKDKRQVKAGLHHKGKARKVHSKCPECHLVMVFKKLWPHGTWENFCLGCNQYYPENKEVDVRPNSKTCLQCKICPFKTALVKPSKARKQLDRHCSSLHDNCATATDRKDNNSSTQGKSEQTVGNLLHYNQHQDNHNHNDDQHEQMI